MGTLVGGGPRHPTGICPSLGHGRRHARPDPGLAPTTIDTVPVTATGRQVPPRDPRAHRIHDPCRKRHGSLGWPARTCGSSASGGTGLGIRRCAAWCGGTWQRVREEGNNGTSKITRRSYGHWFPYAHTPDNVVLPRFSGHTGWGRPLPSSRPHAKGWHTFVAAVLNTGRELHVQFLMWIPPLLGTRWVRGGYGQGARSPSCWDP